MSAAKKRSTKIIVPIHPPVGEITGCVIQIPPARGANNRARDHLRVPRPQVKGAARTLFSELCAASLLA